MATEVLTAGRVVVSAINSEKKVTSTFMRGAADVYSFSFFFHSGSV